MMPPDRRQVLGAAAAVALALLAGCGPHRAAAPPPVPGPAATSQPRVAVTAAVPTPPGCVVTARSGVTVVDGRRTVLQPVGAAGTRLAGRVGLVVALPGYGRTAEDLLAQSRLAPRAAAAGVVLAVPQGEGSALAWDFDHVTDADDIGLLRDLVAIAVRTACVDPARVVLTGISDGGDMAAWAGCSAPGLWRAVVTVAASTRPQAGCRPLRLIALHGDADPLDPYLGSPDGRPGYPDVPPALPAIGSWAASDGCSAATTSTAGVDLTLTRYPCGVELITVRGGGHTWPGGVPGDPSLGRTATDLDATGLVLSLV